MKKFYSDYLDSNITYTMMEKVGIACFLFVISGLFGWVYEYIFYYFNFGMKYFYWQGGNFLPWINIYMYGAFLIYLFGRKYKKKPLLIFLIAFVSSGILEYISGFIIFKFFNLRLWDYNTEIWNYGNIGGFVCLRSVLFFGVSGLILIYLLIPIICFICKKMNTKVFFIIGVILFSIVLFDELYNLIIARILDLPRARDIYQTIGIKYMKY